MQTMSHCFWIAVLSTLCASELGAQQGRVIATIPEPRKSTGTIETPAQRAQREAQTHNARAAMIARQRAQANQQPPSGVGATYAPPAFVPPSTYRPPAPTVNVQPRAPTFTPRTSTPQVNVESVMQRNERIAEELRQQAQERRNGQTRPTVVPAPRTYPWTQPSTPAPTTTQRVEPTSPPPSPWGNTLSNTATAGQVRPLTGNSTPIRIIRQIAISEKSNVYGMRVVNASSQAVKVRVWTDMRSYAARPNYGDYLVEFSPGQVLAEPWNLISRSQMSSYVFQVIAD